MKELRINIGNKNFGYPGSKLITLAMLKMPDLEHVELMYEVNKLSYRSVLDVNKTLFGRQKLRTLRVNMMENMIGDEGALVLLRLVRTLSNLQTVFLGFKMASTSGQVSFPRLASNLAHVPNVELDYSNNDIDAEAFQVFKREIGRLRVTANRLVVTFVMNKITEQEKF